MSVRPRESSAIEPRLVLLCNAQAFHLPPSPRQLVTPDSIRLTDLAEPRFSPEIATLRANLASMAQDLDISPDAMRSRAASLIGLDDFGGREYEAPFEALTSAVDRSEILSPVGRFMMHAQFLQLLKNRLLLTDLLTTRTCWKETRRNDCIKRC